MVQVAKRSELHTFKAMPNPWVAEHGFAWLETVTEMVRIEAC